MDDDQQPVIEHGPLRSRDVLFRLETVKAGAGSLPVLALPSEEIPLVPVVLPHVPAHGIRPG
jgi:hypothetical protein